MVEKEGGYDDFADMMIKAVNKLQEKGALYAKFSSSKGSLILMFEDTFNKKYKLRKSIWKK